MKQIFVLVIGLLFVFHSHAQEKNDTIKENSFSFGASYIGDAIRNFSGGIKTGNTYLGLASLMIGFDTDKAGFWKGGELYLNAVNTHGGEPTAMLIGDFQVASNIEAGKLTYMHEFWYKQNIGKASLIFGLQDLCVEFLSSENASLFLNSSCGVHSTIANNLMVPIFPLTALGGQFHYNLTNKFTFKMAIFDGVPDDFSRNNYNLNWKLSKNEGYISFSEFTFRNASQSKPGIFKLGFYYHNNHIITTHDADNNPIYENHPENYGFYIVIDQLLYKNKYGKELSLFSQTSISPKEINENWYYMGAGINYKGLFSKRADDVLGFACAHSGINNKIGSETAFELTYKALLNENFFFQPNFQYIINPAGTDTKLQNSIVGIMRFGVNF